MKIIEKYLENDLYVFESIKNLAMNYASRKLWTYFCNAFVFLLWWIILAVDFQSLCIHCQTQKYTWSKLSELTNLHSNSEVDFLNLQIYTQTLV